MLFLDLVSQIGGWLVGLGLIGVVVALLSSVKGGVVRLVWRRDGKVAGVRWFDWLLMGCFLLVLLGYGSEQPWNEPGIFVFRWALLSVVLLGILALGTWSVQTPWIGVAARLVARCFMIAVAAAPVCYLVLFFMAPLCLPRSQAMAVGCLSNIKQVVLAIDAYTREHDGKLPEAATWQSDVLPYLKGNRLVLRCPTTDKPYIFNEALGGKSLRELADPEQIPVVWEQPDDDGNVPHMKVTGPLDLLGGRRHGVWYNVGYLDGHAENTYGGG